MRLCEERAFCELTIQQKVVKTDRQQQPEQKIFNNALQTQRKRWEMGRYGYNKGKKDEDLNNNRVVEKGLRCLVSCVQRHLKPWSRGRDRGMDGWVTVWWRRHSKREITLLSLLCFSLISLPPFTALSSLVRSCALSYSSSNYLKKRHPLYFWPFLLFCLPCRQILPVRSNKQQVCTTQ